SGFPPGHAGPLRPTLSPDAASAPAPQPAAGPHPAPRRPLRQPPRRQVGGSPVLNPGSPPHLGVSVCPDRSYPLQNTRMRDPSREGGQRYGNRLSGFKGKKESVDS